MNRYINRRTLLPALLALGTLLSAVPTVQAQTFPTKPITLVLPFPPGGSFDPIFRALAEAAAATSVSRSC